MLSCGIITFSEAERLAKEYAPQLNMTQYPMLGHKGIHWFAKQIMERELKCYKLLQLVIAGVSKDDILQMGYEEKEYDDVLTAINAR